MAANRMRFVIMPQEAAVEMIRSVSAGSRLDLSLWCSYSDLVLNSMKSVGHDDRQKTISPAQQISSVSTYTRNCLRSSAIIIRLRRGQAVLKICGLEES